MTPKAAALAPVYQQIREKLAQGGAVQAIAREMGVTKGMVYTARRAMVEDGRSAEPAVPVNPSMAVVRRRLEILIARLEAEDGPLPESFVAP